ncbi:class I SAM-dependent methyltransferase [Roseomonas nepalensis]|uniref:Class I SAM-dependent methyltransferase n=1 Tax=Muricoccus nepalensis TaxID=1854500 RepID=A0A502FJ61_9PROT|nr:class I SAM-dependent methyltransferase [Roseomonas nepalensis]TPG49547.1 class I SAM-dependent methyltransferase [Roseomonas nepalensis]
MSEPSPLSPPDSALLRLLGMLEGQGYRFVTPTPLTHARVNGRPGNEEARDLRDVFGWSRPFREALLPAGMLALLEEGGVLGREGGLCRSRVRVSALEGVLFLHSAYPTTGADAVFFGPDTYRFAAAISAELRARAAPVRRAVDVGCGAGPGGIVVARACPEAEVAMVDINDAALRLARINAAFAGAARARAVNSNLLTGVAGEFDLIVANPPYLVDPAKRAYRHGGGDLGAGLSLAILDSALERLSPGGTLVLYTGAAVVKGEDPFRSAAAARLAGRGEEWSYREMDPDVFGEELEAEAYREADRIAAVVLTVNRRK